MTIREQTLGAVSVKFVCSLLACGRAVTGFYLTSLLFCLLFELLLWGGGGVMGGLDASDTFVSFCAPDSIRRPLLL